MQAILNFAQQTGFYQFSQGGNWKMLIMIAISFVLLYLAIVKQFEPLLLLPIAFGMLCTNLPGADMFHEILFAGGHIHWDMFHGDPIQASELLQLLQDGALPDVIKPYAEQLIAAANGAFGAMMLQANFHLRATEGATLCQNPETQAYALVRPFPLAITDVESLAAGLASLANQTENWRKALAGLNTAEAAKEQSAASTSDGDSHHDMMASGFFHV